MIDFVYYINIKTNGAIFKDMYVPIILLLILFSEIEFNPSSNYFPSIIGLIKCVCYFIYYLRYYFIDKSFRVFSICATYDFSILFYSC